MVVGVVVKATLLTRKQKGFQMTFGPRSLPQTHVNKVFPGTGTDGLSGATMSFDTVMENAALLRSAVSTEMMSGNLFWSHCCFKTNDRLMDRRHWGNGFKSQHSKSKNGAPRFSPSRPSTTGFTSAVYAPKVPSHGFPLQSWSFSGAHFGRVEAGGCLVFELFEEPSTAFTLQLGTPCSVEISPHIGPLCTFTSTQPHSTPLNFILRRGPLKGHIAPFASAVLLIKIGA